MWVWICLALVGVLFAVGLIYHRFLVSYKYFEDRGVPGPKPKFPLGNVPGQITQKRNLIYDLDDIYQEFRGKAPFVGYFEVKSPAILLIDPETVKTVLVKNFRNFHDNIFSKMADKDKDPIFGRNPFMLRGKEWKEKRAEITPAFTPSRVNQSFVSIGRRNFDTKHINDELAKDLKEPFDARDICAKFTTDVVSSCIFNADAQSFTKEKPEIREMGRNIMQMTPWITFWFIMYTFFPFLMKIYKVKMVKKEIEEFFTSLMQQAVEIREKNPVNRDDYLAYLISLRSKKQFSELDMAAHGVSFFIDGFETSSVAIMNALYELGNNKSAQEKLRKEIAELYDSKGKVIYDKLIDHEYLDQVFYESLRLHPPATFTNRECTESIEIEGVKGKKYQMKTGENVMIPIYSIQRDPEFYPEPEKFIPGRFNSEHGGVKAFKDKGVLIPFGDGPRICLGQKFALMQSKAAIAEVVRSFEISANEKTQHPLVIDPKEFINVKIGKIWLDFKALE